MRLIFDAMGGDNAPEAIVKGAVTASITLRCDITLVGDEEKIRAVLNTLEHTGGQDIRVVHASQSIDMEDRATRAIIGKKDSSMNIALKMLSLGEGDAVISAGNTGALLTGATLIVKRIKGIKRAAISTAYPNQRGGSTILIDSGANSDCTPEMLCQFGIMGSNYAKVLGSKNPRVALLNNGTEDTKGNELTKSAYKLLKEQHENGVLNFIGNVEGRDIFSGDFEVLVCDGFTGNILLKTIEGTAYFLLNELKAVFLKNRISKISALFLRKNIQALRSKVDYKRIGGAPILGVSKTVFKAHGSSDEEAIKNAAIGAYNFVQSGIIESMAQTVNH